jgi:hypothetical protein
MRRLLGALRFGLRPTAGVLIAGGVTLPSIWLVNRATSTGTAFCADGEHSLPAKSKRPPRPPSTGDILSVSLLASNAAVYFMWWAPWPRFNQFMLDTFTTSYNQMTREGVRGALTTLTAAFSHTQLWHIGCNMLTLMSFVPRCVDGRHTRSTPKLSLNEFVQMYGVTLYALSWELECISHPSLLPFRVRYLTTSVASSIGSNLFAKYNGTPEIRR